MGKKVKGPVCGMEVEKDTATVRSEHMGKIFYFCSAVCRERFDRKPGK